MKRILSLLLAAALAAALLAPPVFASAQPWAQVSGRGSACQTVTLQGVAGSCNGVQLTLTLDSAPGSITFSRPGANPQDHFTYRLEGSRLTLYVTSKTLLNQGGSLSLGELTADGDFTVTAVSDVKLLNVGPSDTQTTSYDRLSMSAPAGSGSSTILDGVGSGSGSADGSNGPDSSASAPSGPLPFTDVGQNDWFYDAVAYVYDAGLMNGAGGGRFNPGGTTTRGMIVTVLHRYEGSPAAAAAGFPDVPAGQYYTGAVAWAAANGVVTGYDSGLFGPDHTITREQMAAILYRYAKLKGLDVSGRADLSGYVDADRVSPYAADAMAWACRTGLITGVDSRTLQPAGSATRAQVATILTRFCRYVEGR